MRRTPRYRTLLPAASLALAVLLGGCRSPWVTETISNDSSQNIREVEVSYPKASFGVDAIPPGQHYQYRYKLTADGATSIQFVDVDGKLHTFSGPSLRQHTELHLEAHITPKLDIVWSQTGH